MARPFSRAAVRRRLLPAVLAAAIGAARAGLAAEELEVESAAVAVGATEAAVNVRATGAAGAIGAFVLSVRFDAADLSLLDFAPAGTWLPANAPDFVAVIGTPAEPGTAGIAGLAVVADTLDDGVAKSIPPAGGGALQSIARMRFGLHPTPAGQSPLAVDLVDGAARFGTAPPLINSLGIGAQDFFAGSPSTPLVLRNGSITLPTAGFLRGDTDSSRTLDLTDSIFELNYLFLAGPTPACFDAADVDDSGVLDLTDPVYSLNFQFLAGPKPPAPGHLECGVDPTPDAEGRDLGCAEGCR